MPAPPVVFCHGTPWSSVVWRPIVDALSDRYTVYLWDMPGYGRSSKQPDHPVDFGVQAEVLDALIRHWEIARPHVIAHDFGGAVSLRAHLVCGADIASLMLVDVVAIPPSGSPFFRFVQDNPGLLDQLPGYVHRAIVRAYISNASSVGLRADDLDALVKPWTGTTARLLSTDRSSTTTSAICAKTKRVSETHCAGSHRVGRAGRLDTCRTGPSPARAHPALDTAHRAWQQPPDSLRRTRAADV